MKTKAYEFIGVEEIEALGKKLFTLVEVDPTQKDFVTLILIKSGIYTLLTREKYNALSEGLDAILSAYETA